MMADPVSIGFVHTGTFTQCKKIMQVEVTVVEEVQAP